MFLGVTRRFLPPPPYFCLSILGSQNSSSRALALHFHVCNLSIIKAPGVKYTALLIASLPAPHASDWSARIGLIVIGFWFCKGQRTLHGSFFKKTTIWLSHSITVKN